MKTKIFEYALSILSGPERTDFVYESDLADVYMYNNDSYATSTLNVTDINIYVFNHNIKYSVYRNKIVTYNTERFQGNAFPIVEFEQAESYYFQQSTIKELTISLEEYKALTQIAALLKRMG